MKKIVYLFSSLFLVIAFNVYAMEYKPGPYVGGQVGWGRIDEGDGYKQYINNLTANEVKRGEFGGWRAYGGYSFIPFFSIEAGYSYYPDNTYTATSTNINIKTYAIDLVGKITVPLGMIAKPLFHFSIYGKGGGAYLNTKIETINSIKKSDYAIRPTYGAGIVFNFTDNIAIDASWTSILGKNKINGSSADEVKTKNPVPGSNLFTLGFSYKITGIF